jgi:DNA-binding transcriptional ArsR family regulator
MPVEESISKTVKRLALGGTSPFLKDDEIFIRTHLGRIEIQNPTSTIPRRLRTMLLLVDGRRTLSDFRRSMTRYRNLDESLDMLFKMGLIERLPDFMEW